MHHSASSSDAKAFHDSSVPPPFKGGGVSRLSAGDVIGASMVREGRWRPGLADHPLHSEIFASSSDASGAGLALALARDALASAPAMDDPLADKEDRRQVLWVQESRAIQLSGRPYVQGLPKEQRERLIHVEASSCEDALFALEEGLKCRDLACVIGEITGNPRGFSFTASRRLSLAAEKHGVALWLVRLDARPDLSSARMRWRVEPAPSKRPLWNADAPGTPTWKADLFRASRHTPGQWVLSHDKARLCTVHPAITAAANTPDFGHMVRPTVGRSLAAVARA